MSLLKMQTKCSGKNEGDIKTDNKIMEKYVGYVLLENSVEIKLASHFIRELVANMTKPLAVHSISTNSTRSSTLYGHQF
jgi:hypothetical protein